METKHTPGPWRIMQGIASGIITSESGVIVNGDGCAPMERSQEEIDANARLIAAAPDLLAACQEWVRIETDGIRDIDGRKVLALMYSTKAAIAKATQEGK